MASRKRNTQPTNDNPPVVDGRVPPHNLDSEAAVLSACMIDPGSTVDALISVGLKPEHFYSEAHNKIFEAILALHAVGKPVDLVQVGTWLKDHDRIGQIGGMAYLTEILNSAPAVANVAAYGETVRVKWRERRFIALCQRAAAKGYLAKTPEEAKALREEHEKALYELADIDVGSGKLERLGRVLRRTHSKMVDQEQRKRDGKSVIDNPWGFERLDRMTAGLHDGDSTIIGARPGMGKTSFVLEVAKTMATTTRDPVTDVVDRLGRGVAVFSMEMPSEQLAQRAACSDGKIELRKARAAEMNDADWKRWVRACEGLENLPISIDETPNLALEEIRAKARRFAGELQREGRTLGLIVVDYIGLMRTGDDDNRARALGVVATGMKTLAKELKCAVIVLAQLNRSVETRTDKRPHIPDLRDSGEIEEAADNILFLYRDEYYRKDSAAKGIVEVIIAKQRNGPAGTVKLKFEAWCTRFENLPDGVHDEEAA